MAEDAGGLESRYTSNEWLNPIATEAKPIFARFPRDTAIEVASAVLKGVDKGETQIPWVTVFPSDDKHHVGSRLLEDYIFETAILISETKRLNKNAHQKPSTVNPGTI